MWLLIEHSDGAPGHEQDMGVWRDADAQRWPVVRPIADESKSPHGYGLFWTPVPEGGFGGSRDGP